MLGLGAGLNRSGFIKPFGGPSEIAGLQLWLDAIDTTTLNAKMAASFTNTNSEYLSSSSTDFDKGNSDFSFGCWWKPSRSATEFIMGKWGESSSKRSYLIYSNAGTITAGICHNGITSDVQSSGVSITIGNWYFIVWTHDSVNDFYKISVNGANYVSKAFTFGTYDPSLPRDFKIGSGDAFYLSGVVDGAFFYDKVLSQDEVTALYNSGSGVAYENLSAGQLTSLVSWWSLNETSGDRVDEVGANTLTDNNTVTYDLGKVQEPIENNEYAWNWIDKSSNAVLTYQQDTAASQPKWQNSKELYFDGADYIVLNDLLTYVSTDIKGTICMWVKPVDATPVAVNMLFTFGDTDAASDIQLSIQTNGVITAALRTGGTFQWQINTNSAAVSDNTWTHISLVQNGVLPVIYINGVAVAQTTVIGTDTTQWINDIPGLDNVRLADRKYNSGVDELFFNGSIGQPLYYSTNLTASQIDKVYNNQLSYYS